MTVHIVGAGLAGLSCALAVVDAGHEVVLHEGAGQAGGRCRSWFDQTLGAVIDNGTHMVVGGNRAVFAYLRRIGSVDRLTAGPAVLPFHDLADGAAWRADPVTLLPSVLASAWRMAGGGDDSVTARLGPSSHYRRFWEPLTVAIMNTPAEQASARVFRRVLGRTLWRGGRASRSWLARDTLADCFVAPAVEALRQAGAELRFHHPLRRLEMSGSRVAALEFDDATVRPGRADTVVLALPWTVAAGLLPTLPHLPHSPIVNAHFRLTEALPRPLPDGCLGLLGGVGQWLFLRGDLLSVTVSAAAAIVDWPSEAIADHLWAECAQALGLSAPPAAVRVIKEKRATLFHSPEVERLRPSPRVADNLLLAGDWTATGLPCTLEGAILSGRYSFNQIFHRQ